MSVRVLQLQRFEIRALDANPCVDGVGPVLRLYRRIAGLERRSARDLVLQLRMPRLREAQVAAQLLERVLFLLNAREKAAVARWQRVCIGPLKLCQRLLR